MYKEAVILPVRWVGHISRVYLLLKSYKRSDCLVRACILYVTMYCTRPGLERYEVRQLHVLLGLPSFPRHPKACMYIKPRPNYVRKMGLCDFHFWCECSTLSQADDRSKRWVGDLTAAEHPHGHQVTP